MMLAVKSGGWPLKSENAYLAEVFDSIQGEGMLVGSRQIFIRFCGCNLRCYYCDTITGLEKKPQCAVYYKPVLDSPPELLDNPISINRLREIIAGFAPRWISFTGGEPLLWHEFITELATDLKPQGYKIMLETNGTLYEQMDKCCNLVDVVSMDYKLPSSTGCNYKEQHSKFLKAALKSNVFIKMVLTSNTNWAEIKEAISVISSFSSDLVLYLQPVTPHKCADKIDYNFLLDIQKYCQDYIPETRILPQIHPYLKWI